MRYSAVTPRSVLGTYPSVIPRTCSLSGRSGRVSTTLPIGRHCPVELGRRACPRRQNTEGPSRPSRPHHFAIYWVSSKPGVGGRGQIEIGTSYLQYLRDGCTYMHLNYVYRHHPLYTQPYGPFFELGRDP